LKHIICASSAFIFLFFKTRKFHCKTKPIQNSQTDRLDNEERKSTEEKQKNNRLKRTTVVEDAPPAPHLEIQRKYISYYVSALSKVNLCSSNFYKKYKSIQQSNPDGGGIKG